MHQSIIGQFSLDVGITSDFYLFQSFVLSAWSNCLWRDYVSYIIQVQWDSAWFGLKPLLHCFYLPSLSSPRLLCPRHVVSLFLKHVRFIPTWGPLHLLFMLPEILFPQFIASFFCAFQSQLKYPLLRENIPAHLIKISLPCTFYCVSSF